jgi:hypothetical protein
MCQMARRICHREVEMMQDTATNSSATPAPGASDAVFGQAATFNSDVGFVLDVSSDKKAFTASFSGLAVSLDGKSSAPIVSRAFSFALPLTGADPGMEIPFFVQGFVLSGKGANGHLVFTVNDQSIVADFPGSSKNDFLQQINYRVGDATEARITVFLAADRDSTSDSAINLNVTAIDTDILKHPG